MDLTALGTAGSARTVLLGGTPRCGSTWLANVLGKTPGARTVYEPDGPISDILGALVAAKLGPYPVLRPSDKSGWYKVVWDLAFAGGWPWDRVEAARAAGRKMVKIPESARDGLVAALAAGTARVRRKPERVIVKSVNSAFSLEWIAARYEPRMVILHRNPLNVVSSWMVLGMAENWPVGEHPYIRERYVEPLGLTPPPAESPPVVSVAWKVGLLMHVLRDTASRHPEWIQVSYDDLSQNPLEGCQRLFAQIGLPWTEEAANYLRQADDPSFVVHGGNPKAHPNALTATETTNRRSQQGSQFRRRLDERQIEEALGVLEGFRLGAWGPRLD